jgi:hypothetical protein
MEFEIWRLTSAEKLELNWKILRTFLLEVDLEFESADSLNPHYREHRVASCDLPPWSCDPAVAQLRRRRREEVCVRPVPSAATPMGRTGSATSPRSCASRCSSVWDAHAKPRAPACSRDRGAASGPSSATSINFDDVGDPDSLGAALATVRPDLDRLRISDNRCAYAPSRGSPRCYARLTGLLLLLQRPFEPRSLGSPLPTPAQARHGDVLPP